VTFDDLTIELLDRAFDGLTIPRAERYVNAARAELDRMFLWPWREKTTTGTSPLPVSDLGRIAAVTNSSQRYDLSAADFHSLSDAYGDLSIAGSPGLYYVSWASGTPTVTTFPSNGDTLSVRYWKVTPDLVNGTDVPDSPSEAHYTIVDLAVRRAYRDNDEHDNAAALQPEIDNAIAQLLEAYPPGTPDGPEAYVGVTGASCDW
jgi:hypothetical protein